MAAFSDYLENALLDHVLRGVAYASPATVYLALFLTDPTDADSGTEVTGGAYARRSITFAAAAGGSVSNNALVTFPTATADWGVVAYIALYDALTAGNLLFHSRLRDSATVLSGQTMSYPAGDLSVTLE